MLLCMSYFILMFVYQERVELFENKMDDGHRREIIAS